MESEERILKKCSDLEPTELKVQV